MKTELADILWAAYHAKFGVVVETDDFDRLRSKLYPLKKETPEFANLSFLQSPTNGKDLWIIKTGDLNET